MTQNECCIGKGFKHLYALLFLSFALCLLLSGCHQTVTVSGSGRYCQGGCFEAGTPKPVEPTIVQPQAIPTQIVPQTRTESSSEVLPSGYKLVQDVLEQGLEPMNKDEQAAEEDVAKGS